MARDCRESFGPCVSKAQHWRRTVVPALELREFHGPRILGRGAVVKVDVRLFPRPERERPARLMALPPQVTRPGRSAVLGSPDERTSGPGAATERAERRFDFHDDGRTQSL